MGEFCYFCDRDLAQRYKLEGLVLDVSTNSLPFNMFSPFYVWDDKEIPVPGQEHLKSRSVEGIWQGLKIIEGKTDHSLFDAEKVKKRRTEPYGSCKFKYGSEEIDYHKARENIFKTAYEWMYHNLIPEVIKEALYMIADADIKIYIFDMDGNPDISDTSSSYSHASLLVDIINEELQARRTDCKTK